MEKSWKVIRDEGLLALKAKKGFLNESESLRKTGDWKQFEMFSRGMFMFVFFLYFCKYILIFLFYPESK